MNSLWSNSISLANAQQVSRSGSFDLPCDADTAFPLFSPEGERKWEVDWDPQPVFPEEIVFERNTVFRQGKGDEEAIWTILDADWQTHRAEYFRLSPACHTARILVKVEPLGSERCQVVVSYILTVFGKNAAAQLDPFSESAYAHRMGSWQRQIVAYLQSQSPR